MKYIVFLLMITITGYSQTIDRNNVIARQKLQYSGGNPDSNKIAVSVDANGIFKWVYFTDFQDSVNTGIYDTTTANVVVTQAIRITGATFASDTLLSIGSGGEVSKCLAVCDDIRWTTNDSLNTFLKIDGNVGIGTSAPTSKVEITGTYYQQSDSSGAQNIISSGSPISTSFFSYYTGIALLSSESAQAQLLVVADTGVIIGTNGAMGDGLFSVRGDNLLRIFDVKSNGNVGINTETPTEKLHVAGTSIFTDTLTYQNGTQADGYVLTSDADGNATWEDINTKIFTLPTYADDAAAGAGGLITGRLYKTATGEVRIKL